METYFNALECIQGFPLLLVFIYMEISLLNELEEEAYHTNSHLI